MNGYETKELRAAHIKALVVELDSVKREIGHTEKRLKGEDRRVQRAVLEERLDGLTGRVDSIQDQLRAFKGESPQRRASKRQVDDSAPKAGPVETR